MTPKLIATAAFLLLGLPAAAQMGNPGNLDPATPMTEDGTPDPDHANSHDTLSAQLLAEGGLAEVSFGNLAIDRAEAESVREFATLMVRDHENANARLKALASAAGIPLPDEMNAQHQATYADLENLSGPAFDLAYIEGQIIDHQKTLLLLSGEVDSGQNKPLQAAAAELLPIVQDHLARAEAIHAQLTGSVPASPAPRTRPQTGLDDKGKVDGAD